MPTDQEIETQIDALEFERENIREREGSDDVSLEDDVARLEEIRIDLERLWTCCASDARCAAPGRIQKPPRNARLRPSRSTGSS